MGGLGTGVWLSPRGMWPRKCSLVDRRLSKRKAISGGFSDLQFPFLGGWLSVSSFCTGVFPCTILNKEFLFSRVVPFHCDTCCLSMGKGECSVWLLSQYLVSGMKLHCTDLSSLWNPHFRIRDCLPTLSFFPSYHTDPDLFLPWEDLCKGSFVLTCLICQTFIECIRHVCKALCLALEHVRGFLGSIAFNKVFGDWEWTCEPY